MLSSLKPYEGLQGILRELQKVTALGIVTASPERYARDVLEAILPDIRWNTIVTGSQTAARYGKRAKPYPEGIELALEDLRLGPETVAYVGDQRGDLEAAYHAGVRPVLALWECQNAFKFGEKGRTNFDPFDKIQIETYADAFQLPGDTILWRPSDLVHYYKNPDAFLPALENDADQLRVIPFHRASGSYSVTGISLGRYYQ